MLSKDELRKAMKQSRRELSPEELRARSASIVGKVLQLPEVAWATTFFIYVSYRNEVHTHDLIRELLSKGKLVTVPKTISTELMEAHQITRLDELTAGAFGIPAPSGTVEFTGPLDVCIAPGLAFTETGDRLGYGKGHYDRFLERHPGLLVVGLCFAFQIVPGFPTEPTDRRMNAIVTDERVIRPARA